MKQADYDADVEAFTRAIAADNGMFMGSWSDVTADYTTAWIAGGIAVIGLLMLVAALTIKAARPVA